MVFLQAPGTNFKSNNGKYPKNEIYCMLVPYRELV